MRPGGAFRAGRTPLTMRLARRHPLLLALLLGALAATGFAPLGLWPVTLACIAGLMALADDSPHHEKWRTFLIGWSFGVGHFTVGLNWIAHAFIYQDTMPHWLGIFAVIALSLYLALFPALATMGTSLIRVRLPAIALTPLFAGLWVLSEYGRATIFTGFAWDPLGMVWLGTGVDQTAAWIGTYGLSALAVIAGGALLTMARGRWRVALPTIAVLVILAIIGQIRMAQPLPDTRIAITVVQPNIDQAEKYASEEANFRKLATLTGPSSPARPRLIFWPEAALEAWLDVEPEWLMRVAALPGSRDLLMTGGVKPYIEDTPGGRRLVAAANSTWVVSPRIGLAARYDKAHLVPYGEYLPMRSILEPIGLSRLVPGDADFLPGPGPRSLFLPAGDGRPALRMGVQICYEIIFSGHVVDARNRPDFLFNPSNDAWFGSWGPPQHLAQARMRAIEEAMPIIRSTPTGISAVIDGRGRLIASIPHHKAAAINATLPAPMAATPFARMGNAIPLCLALLLVLLSAIPLARKPASR